MSSCSSTDADYFTRPIELKCVLDADARMRKLTIPMVLLAFPVFLLVALPLGLMFPSKGWISFVGGAVAGIAVPTVLYLRRRRQLRYTYAAQQRLVLHPGGIQRTDGTIRTDMPWSAIHRLEHRNSALAADTNVVAELANRYTALGIVGAGTVSPLPGASPRLLEAHDRSGGSELRLGRQHRSPNCVVFPAEFEHDWTHGVVGAWLRHYRPDLQVPAV